jgi:hypothetical protein
LTARPGHASEDLVGDTFDHVLGDAEVPKSGQLWISPIGLNVIGEPVP